MNFLTYFCENTEIGNPALRFLVLASRSPGGRYRSIRKSIQRLGIRHTIKALLPKVCGPEVLVKKRDLAIPFSIVSDYNWAAIALFIPNLDQIFLLLLIIGFETFAQPAENCQKDLILGAKMTPHVFDTT